MMENFRANPPKELGGSKVILSKDYKTLKQTDDKGNVTAIDMPEPSNVLQYFTEDGSKVSVRPSGTEPKIKFYMEVQGEMGCRNCYASAESAAMEKIEAVKNHWVSDLVSSEISDIDHKKINNKIAPL